MDTPSSWCLFSLISLSLGILLFHLYELAGSNQLSLPLYQASLIGSFFLSTDCRGKSNCEEQKWQMLFYTGNTSSTRAGAGSWDELPLLSRWYLLSEDNKDLFPYCTGRMTEKAWSVSCAGRPILFPPLLRTAGVYSCSAHAQANSNSVHGKCKWTLEVYFISIKKKLKLDFCMLFRPSNKTERLDVGYYTM